MSCCMLACSIFRPELERVLPEIVAEHPEIFAGRDVDIEFVQSALHVDYKKLRQGIAEGFARCESGNTALLYGFMCHPDLPQIAAEHDVPYLRVGNCIEIFLTPEQKRKIDADGLTYYLTTGWLADWRSFFVEAMGWDTYDARANLGRYDRILMLDTGICPYTDEDILDFFEFTTVPIEIEPIGLDVFKENVVELCQRAFQPVAMLSGTAS